MCGRIAYMPSGAKTPPGRFSQEIAGILRAQRARKQIGQKELAAAVQISQSQLSGILTGAKHVDIEKLDELCWALGLELVKDVLAPADEALALRQTEPEWTATRLAD